MLSNNAPWYGLEAYRTGVETTLKLYMEGQGHIFTIDLIFSGQHAILRCPAFSKQYFFQL